MFKKADGYTKAVIGTLLVFLLTQSYMYHKLKNSKVVEVEAKICKAENVICSYSQQLTDLGTDDTPTYMCMEVAPEGDSQ